MYTPVPRDEKLAARAQWHEEVDKYFPCIVYTSEQLQAALRIESARPHAAPIFYPWQFPSAQSNPFSTGFVPENYTGSFDASWTVPGASDDESLGFDTFYYDDDNQDTASVVSFGNDSSDSQENGVTITSPLADICLTDTIDTIFEESANWEGNFQENTVEEEPCLEDNGGAITSMQPTSPSTPPNQIKEGTPFPSSNTKRASHQASATLSMISFSEGTVTPSSQSSLPPPENLLRHVFVNHEEQEKELNNIMVMGEDILESSVEMLDATHIFSSVTKERGCSHDFRFCSPFVYVSRHRPRNSSIAFGEQAEPTTSARHHAPRATASEALLLHRITNGPKGLPVSTIDFDLHALSNGEICIHGYTSSSIQRAASIIDTKLSLNAQVPLVLDMKSKIPIYCLDITQTSSFWVTTLKDNLNYWLREPDTLISVTTLSSFMFGSAFDALYVSLHEDASNIRLIQLRLDGRCRGPLHQGEPLDWIVIEIVWHSPRKAGVVLAFPSQSITATTQHVDMTTLKFLQPGRVPAAYGIDVNWQTLEPFMEACALGRGEITIVV